MRIDCGFSLTDMAVSSMRNQSKRMLNIISGVGNERTTIPDMVGTEGDIIAEIGDKSRGSLIDMDNVSIQMTNLNIAAHTYEANVGLLGRYKQMTETKLELLG